MANTRSASSPSRVIACLWNRWGGWPGRLAVAGCLTVSAGYFLLVGLLLIHGIPWAFIVYAEDPYAHLAGGLSFLFAAWVLARGWRSPAREWRRMLAKAILLLVSLSLSFAAGELLLRKILLKRQADQSFDRFAELYAKGIRPRVQSEHPMAFIIQPSADKRQIYELRPNLDMQFGHRRLRTNSRGMRDDREYETDKPPSTCRIVGLGDSGMFGWGVDQGQDYMSVLRNNLGRRNDGRNYEVLNFAVPGYNTQLEVQSLIGKGLAYHPDIVVVGWCDNDFGLPFFLLERENYLRRDRSFMHDLLFNRARFRDAVAGIRVRDQRAYDRSRLEESVLEGENIAGVEKALSELKQLSESHRFHVLLFGSMRREAREVFQRVGLPYYNLRERIPANAYPPEWEVHFMHPRAPGHKVLAEQLEEELGERGWI